MAAHEELNSRIANLRKRIEHAEAEIIAQNEVIAAVELSGRDSREARAVRAQLWLSQETDRAELKRLIEEDLAVVPLDREPDRVPKGYWVVFADVSDPEGYKAYVAENAKAFRKYGGHFLVRGGPAEAAEGRPRSRVVVIEFPSYEAARECYHSPEYAKAMAMRQGKSVMDLAIVQGYEGPQPA
jgi:uncharacterized protein (DUF1330 family)